jgi:hypothetical protein
MSGALCGITYIILEKEATVNPYLRSFSIALSLKCSYMGVLPWNYFLMFFCMISAQRTWLKIPQ